MSKFLLALALLCLMVVAHATTPKLKQQQQQQQQKTTTVTSNISPRALYKTTVSCNPVAIRAEDTSRCVLQGVSRDGSRYKLSNADVKLSLSHGTTGPLQFNQHEGTVAFSVHAPALLSTKLQVSEAHGATADIVVAMKPQSSKLYCDKSHLSLEEDVTCHIESFAADGAKVFAMAEDFALSNTDGLVTPLEQPHADHFTFKFMAPDSLPQGKTSHSVELTDGFSKLSLKIMASGGDAEASPVETSPVETSPVEVSPVEVSPVETSPVETSTGDDNGHGQNLPSGADDVAEAVEVHFITDTDVLSLASFNKGELEHTFVYHDQRHKVYVAIAEDRLSASIMVDDGEVVLESEQVTLDDMSKDPSFNTSVSDDHSIEAHLAPRVLARLLRFDVSTASGSSYEQVAVKSVHLRKIVDVVVDPEQVDWSGIATPPETSGGSSDDNTPSTETSPSEHSPVEVSPVETSPAEPVESSPVETSPVEVSPVEVSPVETSPVEVSPVEVPASVKSAQPLSLPVNHAYGPELTEAHLIKLQKIFQTLGVSNRILAVQFEFYVLGDDKSHNEGQKQKGRKSDDIAHELSKQHEDAESEFRHGEISEHAVAHLSLVSAPVSLDHCTESHSWQQSGLCSANIRASNEAPVNTTSSGAGFGTVGVVLVVVGVVVGAVLTVTGVRAYRQRSRARAEERLRAFNASLLDGSNNAAAAGNALSASAAPRPAYQPPVVEPVNTNDARAEIP